MRTRFMLMVTLLLAALVLAACGSSPAAPAPTPEPEPTADAQPDTQPEAQPGTEPGAAPDSELVGTRWLLSEIAGAPPVASDSPAELEFDPAESRVAGSTGCNRFFGGYTLSEDTISFEQLGSTMMACSDELMQQETSFFQLMEAVTSYSLDGDTLTLNTADGQSLVFVRA
jgi:heat shock protein HslJ